MQQKRLYESVVPCLSAAYYLDTLVWNVVSEALYNASNIFPNEFMNRQLKRKQYTLYNSYLAPSSIVEEQTMNPKTRVIYKAEIRGKRHL